MELSNTEWSHRHVSGKWMRNASKWPSGAGVCGVTVCLSGWLLVVPVWSCVSLQKTFFVLFCIKGRSSSGEKRKEKEKKPASLLQESRTDNKRSKNKIQSLMKEQIKRFLDALLLKASKVAIMR